MNEKLSMSQVGLKKHLEAHEQDKYTRESYQRAVGKMVENEVKVCVSTLISDLCRADLDDDLCSLLVRDDYQSAFEDAGYFDVYYEDDPDYGTGYLVMHGDFDCDDTIYDSREVMWREACEDYSIEPYQREALEHWVVSDWLADRLLERGEMVDKDVHGLTVWGRTCSGQAILLDRVICDIYDELHDAGGSL